MTADHLRRRYLRRFAGWAKYGVVRAWLIVAGYVATIAAAMLWGHVLLSGPPTVLSVLTEAALVLFIGTRLRGLNNIVHECSHSTFARDRRDNIRIGSLCASLLLGCFDSYRRAHITHHQYLGDYEHDLDLQTIEALRLHEPLTRMVLLRHILTPLTGRHLPYYLRWDLSRGDGLGFQVLKMALLLGVVVLAALAPLTALVFVLVPYVLVFSALNYWADCIDHAGLVGAADDMDASRNVMVPAVVKWLFFPRNDCFHLVHHLFPNVPARHLEIVHSTLAEDEFYKSKQNAIGSLGQLAQPEEEGRTASQLP